MIVNQWIAILLMISHGFRTYTSGQATDKGGGLGLSAEQSLQKASYAGIQWEGEEGLVWETTWDIDEGKEHPKLRNVALARGASQPVAADNGGNNNQGQGGDNNQGQGGNDNQGQGGNDNQGQGGNNNQGQGGDNNQGQGGNGNQGQGGNNNQGQGGDNNQGQGGNNNQGQGGDNNQGQGGNNNRGNNFNPPTIINIDNPDRFRNQVTNRSGVNRDGVADQNYNFDSIQESINKLDDLKDKIDTSLKKTRKERESEYLLKKSGTTVLAIGPKLMSTWTTALIDRKNAANTVAAVLFETGGMAYETWKAISGSVWEYGNRINNNAGQIILDEKYFMVELAIKQAERFKSMYDVLKKKCNRSQCSEDDLRDMADYLTGEYLYLKLAENIKDVNMTGEVIWKVTSSELLAESADVLATLTLKKLCDSIKLEGIIYQTDFTNKILSGLADVVRKLEDISRDVSKRHAARAMADAILSKLYRIDIRKVANSLRNAANAANQTLGVVDEATAKGYDIGGDILLDAFVGELLGMLGISSLTI